MTELQKVEFYLLNIEQLSALIVKRLTKGVKIDDTSDVISKLEYIANYLYDLERKI